MRPRRNAIFLIAPRINTLTYLLTYLLSYFSGCNFGKEFCTAGHFAKRIDNLWLIYTLVRRVVSDDDVSYANNERYLIMCFSFYLALIDVEIYVSNARATVSTARTVNFGFFKKV